jgi:hypothetical protein
MNTRLLFLVPDGVGIKNYLYSDIVFYLKEKAAISIWSPLPFQAFEVVEQWHHIKMEYTHLILEVEPILSRFLRESAIFARLIYNSRKVKNPTILTNWNYKPKSLKLFIINKLMEFTGTLIYKNYSLIILFENWSKKFWSKKLISDYKKKLTQSKIDKIFITHQRVASLMPICIAAKQLGIEVITVIYSWDNLPKARLNITADKYLVWSDYMKEELKLYYPEISVDKIIVTGTPQFEFYLKKQYIINKEDFAKEYQLDPYKKWICFSGDDELTSPYDPVYLNDLAEAIKLLPETEQPQIIFRKCPVDFSDRYNMILEKHKNIIISLNPNWYKYTTDNWGSLIPKTNDIHLLVNIAYHCECVINLGSTMVFDFATFNKSCFYLRYNTNHLWNIETIYNFQHFKSMENQSSVFWVKSKNDFVNLLNIDNKQTLKNMEFWFKKVVLHPLENSSINISKILINHD